MTATPSRPDTAEETKAARSTLRADRRFLWFWLVIATTLSVAGNIGHAWLTAVAGASRWMAIGWAVAPPALLMLSIHGLPTLARMLGRTDRDAMLTAVVWGVTIGAFGWSAYGIFGFTSATGIPARMAWLAPIVIDLSVFGATRGLVLTAPLAARMQAGPPAPCSHVPSLPNADVAQPITASHRAEIASTAPDSRRPDSPEVLGAPAAPDEPAHPRTATPRSFTAADTVALAKDIVDSGAVRKPVDTVAAVLAAAADEHRKAVIAEQTGVHHSVVTRILDAAESRRRDALVAAG
ncbi:hypothetical protein ACQ86B_28780 (plasmid) [Mycolicibacterium aichiense]|uniref:hypothetical protein n=1 Tax=Mycolicibacterium aichiense TaxID=1799 RepID=UPI003D672A2A